MKILFLSHHWTNNSHHSKYSGFQRIVFFAAKFHDVTLVTWGTEAADYMDGAIRVVNVVGRRRDFLFSKRISISTKGFQMAKDFDVVHALYSDCTYKLAPGSFTVTLHVLPGIVRYSSLKHKIFLFLKYYILQRRAFARAKNMAVVSRNLLEAIPEKYRQKASFIPHGVDTSFWNPALASEQSLFPGNNYILCVGSHGLDMNLLNEFVGANPSLQFVFVGAKKGKENFGNVHCLEQVEDVELRNLYAGAILMIRPLLFATANNSILEGLSMGKTILVNRIPGILDYLNDETCLFIDTLQSRSLENIKERLRDPERVRQATIEKFDWNKVLEAYSRLYSE